MNIQQPNNIWTYNDQLSTYRISSSDVLYMDRSNILTPILYINLDFLDLSLTEADIRLYFRNIVQFADHNGYRIIYVNYINTTLYEIIMKYRIIINIELITRGIKLYIYNIILNDNNFLETNILWCSIAKQEESCFLVNYPSNIDDIIEKFKLNITYSIPKNDFGNICDLCIHSKIRNYIYISKNKPSDKDINDNLIQNIIYYIITKLIECKNDFEIDSFYYSIIYSMTYPINTGYELSRDNLIYLLNTLEFYFSDIYSTLLLYSKKIIFPIGYINVFDTYLDDSNNNNNNICKTIAILDKEVKIIGLYYSAINNINNRQPVSAVAEKEQPVSVVAENDLVARAIDNIKTINNKKIKDKDGDKDAPDTYKIEQLNKSITEYKNKIINTILRRQTIIFPNILYDLFKIIRLLDPVLQSDSEATDDYGELNKTIAKLSATMIDRDNIIYVIISSINNIILLIKAQSDKKDIYREISKIINNSIMFIFGNLQRSFSYSEENPILKLDLLYANITNKLELLELYNIIDNNHKYICTNLLNTIKELYETNNLYIYMTLDEKTFYMDFCLLVDKWNRFHEKTIVDKYFNIPVIPTIQYNSSLVDALKIEFPNNHLLELFKLKIQNNINYETKYKSYDSYNKTKDIMAELYKYVYTEISNNNMSDEVKS